jgi:hypothetical protein
MEIKRENCRKFSFATILLHLFHKEIDTNLTILNRKLAKFSPNIVFQHPVALIYHFTHSLPSLIQLFTISP